MKQLGIDRLRLVLSAEEPPCISVYQPTHRRHPENQQDPIRFKNLAKEVEASLKQKYPSRELRPLLTKFQELEVNARFWNHTLDGLVLFANADHFEVFELPRNVPELAIVANSYHLEPLIRYFQSADRFQVLGLSRDRAKLYEGSRDGLDEIDPSADLSSAIEAAASPVDGERKHGITSTGGGAIHHGQASRKDKADEDAEKFFRAVDRAVTEHHSKPSGLPLLLVALPENMDAIRKVSHNPHLLPVGVAIDPFSQDADRLRDLAWKTFEPAYLARLAALSDEFNEAASKSHGSGDLSDIAQAVVARRVKTLLIDADQKVPGRLDPVTGRIEFDDLAHPEVDDLLDDLAEAVLRTGGDVVVVPGDRMPTRSGAAATFRF